MPDAVPVVLWSWVPVTLLLFGKLPPRRAAVASLIGGWLFLPTARFANDVAGIEFPYWIMPACLPSAYWTTKARIIGVATLLGVMAFDSGAWRRLRPVLSDLPILGWCLCPLLSDLANGLGPARAVADTGYQAMAWGMPYLLGRLYFADPPGSEELARGLVGGGLVYLPLCALEFVVGPVLYATLYGFHPYRTPGMVRYIGYRPLVFLEDGNQLGIWLASAAFAAFWLWRSGRLRRFWGLPGALVLGALLAQSLLAQSVGAVVLLLGVLAAMEVVHRLDRTWPIALAVGLVMVLAGVRAANLVDAKALVMKSSLGRRLVDASIRLDRQSFGWRLRVEERGARVALRSPWLGRGSWDWWRLGRTGERPWGLPILVLGQYGLAGWVCLLATCAGPVVAFLNLGPPRFWSTTSRASAATLAGVLAINELDALLNPCFFLPCLAAMGGLVGLRLHARAASAWVERLRRPSA